MCECVCKRASACLRAYNMCTCVCVTELECVCVRVCV